MTREFRTLASVLCLTLAVAACAASSSPTAGTPTAQATTETSAAPTAQATTETSAAPTAQATTEASGSPTASGAAAICADAARFRASTTALTDLTLATVGVSGVTSALAEVQSAAQALAVSGHDLVGQPVSNLLTSVQALQTDADRTRRSAEPRRKACRGEGGDRADQDGGFRCGVRPGDCLPGQLATRRRAQRLRMRWSLSG